MIMFWNQKEVFVGYSMQKFAEVRNQLRDHGIRYHYRIVSNTGTQLFGPGRARIGSMGINPEYANTYYVYVHQKDFAAATAVLRP